MATNNSFCEQRRLTQLYNIPLVRVTPISPYSSGFTKLQLDMRRKAEILKYSANKSSSQTNSLTKKERFALLARWVKNTPSTTEEVLTACDSVQVPTTSSDVPGPVMLLKMDETVPLYNYSEFNTRTYPDYIPIDTTQWQFIPLQNIIIYDNAKESTHYLIINNNVDQPVHTYTITVPIGITLAGLIPASYVPPIDFSGGILQLNITQADLVVYYMNNIVTTVSPNNLTGASMRISVPVHNVNKWAFNATRFIGNLVFNNVQLYTAPTYVYKFAINVNITITPNNTNAVNYVAMIANSTDSGFSSAGCLILDSPSADINTGSNIVG